MGIASEILSSGWQSQAFTVFSGKQQMIRMTFSELESSYPFVLSLPQFETEQLLADCVTKYSGTIERNTTLIGLIQNQNADSVAVQIKLPDGKIERVDFDYVIGCDGADSDVRRMLEIERTQSRYVEQYVLADIDFESSLNLTDHYIFSGAKEIAGFSPISNTQARIFAHLGRIKPDSEESSQSSDSYESSKTAKSFNSPEPSIEDLQKLLDERGPAKVTIKKLNWLSMHSVRQGQAKNYQSGRTFLCGDAAQVQSPINGQGLNLGIQDAYNLAWKLTLVSNNQASSKLLSSYSDERHLAGKQMTAMTDLFSFINNLRSPLFRIIRNKLGPILSSPEDVRYRYRNAVSGLSTNYRLSSAIQQDKYAAYGPQAGDRMPDGLVVDIANKKIARLFELTSGQKHHLLLLTRMSDSEQTTKVADSIESSVNENFSAQIECHRISLIDTDPLTHRLLDSQDTSIYLIRPDGYVGFRSEKFDAKAFYDYLSRTFKQSEKV